MTEYELEQAAYNRGFQDGVKSESTRIIEIVKDELLSDYESPPWNVFMWQRIIKRVYGETA